MENFVYIKNSVKNHFVTLDNELPVTAYVIGSSLEDYYDNKWVLLSSEQVQFHKEHPTASVSEVWNMEIEVPAEPTLEELLRKAKQEKIFEIELYDRSEYVNSFFLGEQQMWLTREERTQIDESINAYEAVGATEMTKYFGGVVYTFPLALWKQMLNALIVYASEALNVTEAHKAAVLALESIEAVKNYDIIAGYPQKISFGELPGNQNVE